MWDKLLEERKWDNVAIPSIDYKQDEMIPIFSDKAMRAVIYTLDDMINKVARDEATFDLLRTGSRAIEDDVKQWLINKKKIWYLASERSEAWRGAKQRAVRTPAST